MGAVMERRDGEDDGSEIGRELPEGGNRHGSGNGEERRGRRWKRDRERATRGRQ